MKRTLLIGPPGSSKFAWARSQQKNTVDEKLSSDIFYTYHLVGLEMCSRAPFRAPHHTISEQGLFGKLENGWKWRPGECSLAHGGILLLDNLPEFKKAILDELLTVLTENQIVLYSGSNHHMIVPCKFDFIATMFPCPCGFLNANSHNPDGNRCKCTKEQIIRYRERVEEFIEICDIKEFPL